MKAIIIILSIITLIFFGITCNYNVKSYKNVDAEMKQKGKKTTACFSLFAIADVVFIIIFLLSKV